MTRPLMVAGARADALSRALPTRNAFHLSRKLFHLLSGFAYALLTRNAPPPAARSLMFVLVLLVFVVELSRIRSPHGVVNRLVLSSFKSFLRRHEAAQFSGTLYYTLGVALSACYFPATAACVGILALALADPVAAFFGFAFEPLLPEARLRNGKSVAGFLFAAFAAILTTFAALACAVRTTMGVREALVVAVPVGITAAFTELLVPTPQLVLPFRHVPLGLDDNFFIPIASSAVCAYLLDKRLHDIELSPFLLCKPFTAV